MKDGANVILLLPPLNSEFNKPYEKMVNFVILFFHIARVKCALNIKFKVNCIGQDMTVIMKGRRCPDVDFFPETADNEKCRAEYDEKR